MYISFSLDRVKCRGCPQCRGHGIVRHAVGTLGGCSGTGTGTNGFLESCFGSGLTPLENFDFVRLFFRFVRLF